MNKRLAKTIIKQYAKNEKINAHTDNYHLLALHLGDEEIINQTEHAMKCQRPEHVGHPYVIPATTDHILNQFYYKLRDLANSADKVMTVIAVSKNTNSFGLRQAYLLAPDGDGKRILINMHSDLKEGDDVDYVNGRLQTDHECPHTIENAAPNRAPILIKLAKENAAKATA